MNDQKNTRGSNSAHVRRYNECTVLHLLREFGQASKADLARATHLTNAAIGGIIRSLDGSGMIHEVGRIRDGSRGQPATLLRLAPDGAFGIGIHLEVDHAQVGLIDFDGTLLESSTCSLPPLPADESAAILSKHISSMIQAQVSTVSQRVVGIGIGFEAMDEYTNQGVPPFLDELALALQVKSKLPVYISEDPLATARAEAFFGKTKNNFAHIFIGKTLSGTFYVGDDFLRRASGAPADLSYLPSFLHGTPSEQPPAVPHASAWSNDMGAANSLAPHDTSALLPSGIAVDQERNDWPETLARTISQPLDALMAMLDLETVVVNGTVPLPPLERFVRTLSGNLRPQANFTSPLKEVRLGRLGEEAALVGSASLPLHARYAPRLQLLTDFTI